MNTTKSINYLSLFIFFLTAPNLFGQDAQQIRFNQNNLFMTNPGMISTDHTLSVETIYQQNFTKIKNSPKAFLVGVQYYDEGSDFSVGLGLKSQDHDLLTEKVVSTGAAYNVRFSHNNSLNVGLGLEIDFMDLNKDRFNAQNIKDPRLGQLEEERSQSSLITVGGAYHHGEYDAGYNEEFRFRLGVAYQRQITSKSYFSTLSMPTEDRINGVFSSMIPSGKNFTLAPTVELYYYPSVDLFYQATLQGIFGDSFMLGVSYDKSKTLAFQIGADFYRIGVYERENIWRVSANAGFPMGTLEGFGSGYGLSLGYRINDSYW